MLAISFVSFRFDLFRFVSICFVSFRSVSFRFDLFRFDVSFRSVSVSFRTLQGPALKATQMPRSNVELDVMTLGQSHRSYLKVGLVASIIQIKINSEEIYGPGIILANVCTVNKGIKILSWNGPGHDTP